MNDYLLKLTKSEVVSMDAAAADRLIAGGNGDAALLYLCILRHRGALSGTAAEKTLGFSFERLRAAEDALRGMGLLGEREETAEESGEEKPDYSQNDIAEALERDDGFRALETEVARVLNKRLTTADSAMLLGLYDYLSLPADVIYQLVCHCVERTERAYGPGRRPTMRQVEKEGYIWRRRGIDSIARANAYLKTYSRRQGLLPKYMAVLQLGDRAPSPAEEKYLTEWIEMGFPPETVALAYDRTVLRCHEFRWGYLGGILKKWHEKGLHSPEEIEREESAAPKKKKTTAAGEKNSGMEQYIKKMHKK